MTLFMDVHHGMQGVTADQLRQGHEAALAVQQEIGVQFQHTWADPDSGTVFCLTEAPSADAVNQLHDRVGGRPDEIHPVPLTV
jgi:hypothetical protein